MEKSAAVSTKKPAKKARESQLATEAGQKKRLEVLQQFRVLLRSIKSHYQWVEKECGISGSQLWSMAEIEASPGIKVSMLAQQLGVHLSTASNMVRRLEELELVNRMRIGEDHRVVQLKLTAKGEKALQRAPRPLSGILQQALAELAPSRLDSLNADLGELIRLMKYKDLKARTSPLSEL